MAILGKLIWLPLLLTVVSAVILRNHNNGPTPIVMWHGMGDTCCAKGIGGIAKLLQANISGVYVHSIEIGTSEDQDRENSYFQAVNKQVDTVCKNLSATPELKNGYHAIGFSQGGQFLRAVAQRCPDPPMLNLVSMGGQHQGVFGMPRCPGSTAICNLMRKLLDMGAYTDYVQQRLVQAQYWHDTLKEDVYRKKSLFLADINNEVTKNPQYKENLQKLRNFVMVKFSKDTMVVPKDSEWFGYYCPGQVSTICSLQNSTIYQEDWLGLKAMDAAKKLRFIETDGDHLQFTTQWFLDNIVAPFLT
ncbi:palmitoyl-protein thioesterase 1-like [Paramacrobiotus metropolitanus]|uniref:palmitoyl-protein thioesterase 1-like n=1 Tax=Paramacrobiotus metropolitanus TaxID=2943436 RepID=UPI002446504B|nr:palmitoyl-protein thioesterase 1-like [Paramacrobiotus metropolitanus]